jgi:hypothetical protein
MAPPNLSGTLKNGCASASYSRSSWPTAEAKYAADGYNPPFLNWEQVERHPNRELPKAMFGAFSDNCVTAGRAGWSPPTVTANNQERVSLRFRPTFFRHRLLVRNLPGENPTNS